VVQPQVTQEMNNILTSHFLPEEVDFALSQMQPLKAQGPDGFGVCFYQHHWATVGNSIRKVVLDFLNLGLFDLSLNSTYIALIPKLSQSVDVTNYRHISLCSVLYKIIAKVLANRLKRVIPGIISPQQSAFIPGWLIPNNVIVAYEALHTMHTRMKGKKGSWQLSWI
jgi:hypothetical protein